MSAISFEQQLQRIEDLLRDQAVKLAGLEVSFTSFTTQRLAELEALRRDIKDHEDRLRSLEATKNRFLGYALGGGAFGAAAANGLIKLFG